MRKCLAVAVLGTDGPGPSKSENLFFFRMLPVVCFSTALFSLTWQINMCDVALVYPVGISHIQPEGHRASFRMSIEPEGWQTG